MKKPTEGGRYHRDPDTGKIIKQDVEAAPKAAKPKAAAKTTKGKPQ